MGDEKENDIDILVKMRDIMMCALMPSIGRQHKLVYMTDGILDLKLSQSEDVESSEKID